VASAISTRPSGALPVLLNAAVPVAIHRDLQLVPDNSVVIPPNRCVAQHSRHKQFAAMDVANLIVVGWTESVAMVPTRSVDISIATPMVRRTSVGLEFRGRHYRFVKTTLGVRPELVIKAVVCPELEWSVYVHSGIARLYFSIKFL